LPRFTEVSLMFSWRRLRLVLTFTLGVAPSHYAGAQVAHGWSADAAVGEATVRSSEFLNIGHATAHLSVAQRVVQRGQLAMYAEVSYDWLGRVGPLGANPDLVCVLDRPGAGCRPPYPNVTGPRASIGALYAPFTRVETRVGVGGAAYSVDGTRVGAAVGQLDAAVFPADRLGLTLGVRFAVIPGYRHDRLTMIPVLLGLRLR
jgi:hypothetical protein